MPIFSPQKLSCQHGSRQTPHDHEHGIITSIYIRCAALIGWPLNTNRPCPGAAPDLHDLVDTSACNATHAVMPTVTKKDHAAGFLCSRFRLPPYRQPDVRVPGAGGRKNEGRSRRQLSKRGRGREVKADGCRQRNWAYIGRAVRPVALVSVSGRREG